MAKKILVVDDEESIRELVKAILQAEGYTVREASSGEKCLALLKKQKPDLIIMDIMMPKMSGLETIKRIRGTASTKKIAVVCLTVVSRREHDKKKLDALSIRDYIIKPFDNDELVKRIKNVLS